MLFIHINLLLCCSTRIPFLFHRVCDVGVTTEDIDRIVHEACVERECYPSPLNYHNFPNSCCTSVNEVICHGIPDLRPLQVF